MKKVAVNSRTIKLFCVYILLFLLSVVVGMMFPKADWYINTIGIASILMLLVLAYWLRRSTSLFIGFLLILYSIYSIYIAVYVFPEIRPEFLYRQIGSKTIYVAGMQCIFLSTLTLFFLVMNGIYTGRISFQIKGNKSKCVGYNPIIIVGAVLMLILVTLGGYTSAEVDARAKITPFYEYKTVLIIIGIMYSGKSKPMQVFWLTVVLIFSFMSFVGGNRADAMPVLTAYIFFYHNSMKPKYVVIFAVIAALLMISIGVFRQRIFTGAFDFDLVIDKILQEKLTFDSAYWAYVPSLESIDLAGKLSFVSKLKLLLGQFVYILLGSQGNEYLFNIVLKFNYGYNHFGGFISPIYFYMWLGLFGAVFFSLIVYFYIRIYSREENGSYRTKHTEIYIASSAFFVATVNRWYLYNPYTLIRGQLIMLVAITIVKWFDTYILRRKNIAISERAE